jgi:hypothetical protein
MRQWLQMMIMTVVLMGGGMMGACIQRDMAQANTPKKTTQMESRQMTLPVSVVRLEFEKDADLSAQSDYAEVERLFQEVNAVWSRWGIFWEVSTIETRTISAADFVTPKNGFASPREFRDAAAELIPDHSGDRQWRVYLMRQFPIAGSAVYIVEKSAVLYGELNKEGNRYPVILAHELGHSLGLRHVTIPGNLMYAGPGKTPSTELQLFPMQIRQARQQAAAGPLFMNPGDRGLKGRRPVIN